MKQIFTLIFLSALSYSNSFSQDSFSDDFESYTVGAFLGTSNAKWTTWSNKPGTGEDCQISDEQAKSGTKSIKIFSVSPTGGPQDVILPFGGKRTSGKFTFAMSMYIPTGKNGYFNFQGNTTTGQVWSLNTNFNGDGSVVMATSGGNNLFTGLFPHNKWFEVKIDINLTNNQWTVLLDNVCSGTFINDNNFVSSIDLFPLNNNSLYYVDDVSYSYDMTAPSYASDASVNAVSQIGGKLAGFASNYTYTIKNNGTSPITSLELSINGTSVVHNAIDIAAGGSQAFSYTNPIPLTGGNYSLQIVIEKINGVKGDENECNDRGTVAFFVASPAEHKAVLVEEGTGTWCGWCPRGSIFMDRLSHTYEGLFIPIAVHNGDPMTVAIYDDFMAFSGFPNARINRSIDADPAASEAPFLTEIIKPASAKVNAGVVYDPSTGDFTGEIEAEFIKDNANNQYWFNLVLTEDGVRGSTSAYNQANYYAGGAQGAMGGYEVLPNPVPASQMVYDHVARAVFGLNKDETKFQGVMKTGDKRTAKFKGNIGANAKIENMHVIPILMSIKGYENGNSISFTDAIAKGVSATEDVLVTGVNVYPNPADDQLTFEIELPAASEVSISINDISGRSIANRNYGKLSGNQIIPVNISTLNPGIYTATIATENGMRIEKIVVQ